MYIEVADVLKDSEIEAIQVFLKNAEFTETPVTGVSFLASRSAEDFARLISRALSEMKILPNLIIGGKIAPPLCQRMQQNENTAGRTESAVAMEGFRIDMVAALFLEPLDAYDGGAWRIGDGAWTSPTMLPKAGTLLLYPAQYHYSISKVTRGKQDVAIVWIQSAIKDMSQRNILWDLTALQARVSVIDPVNIQRELEHVAGGIKRIRDNLTRMWSHI